MTETMEKERTPMVSGDSIDTPDNQVGIGGDPDSSAAPVEDAHGDTCPHRTMWDSGVAFCQATVGGAITGGTFGFIHASVTSATPKAVMTRYSAAFAATLQGMTLFREMFLHADYEDTPTITGLAGLCNGFVLGSLGKGLRGGAAAAAIQGVAGTAVHTGYNMYKSSVTKDVVAADLGLVPRHRLEKAGLVGGQEDQRTHIFQNPTHLNTEDLHSQEQMDMRSWVPSWSPVKVLSPEEKAKYMRDLEQRKLAEAEIFLRKQEREQQTKGGA